MTMTVKDLIDRLSKEDPNRVVICAIDGEGSGHTPLAGFWVGRYKAESSYAGEVGIEKLTAADKKRGYTAEDVMTDGVPALILTPTN
jgi:hypothetical protein